MSAPIGADLLSRPWPWYVVGPLLGLFVPLLLVLGNRLLGVSSNLRHICAAVSPPGPGFFRYDWRAVGAWNLAFAAGIIVGGVIAGGIFADPEPVAISAATRADLAALGIHDLSGLVPAELFRWSALATPGGFVALVIGGLLVGFGTGWAGGCTSGHGLAGIADLQLPSLVALISFMVGGVAGAWLLVPLVLRGLQ